MHKRSALKLLATVTFAAAFPLHAQTPASVAGAYVAVVNAAFGSEPRGTMVLTPDGHYAIVLARKSLPKFASNVRVKGSSEENQAVVQGSIAHFGRYAIEDAGRSIVFHIETSTFPNWDGTTQRRPLKISGDLLSYTLVLPTGGGEQAEVSWRRSK